MPAILSIGLGFLFIVTIRPSTTVQAPGRFAPDKIKVRKWWIQGAEVFPEGGAPFRYA